MPECHRCLVNRRQHASGVAFGRASGWWKRAFTGSPCKPSFTSLFPPSAVSTAFRLPIGRQFLGPARKGSLRRRGLLKEWPSEGPKAVLGLKGFGMSGIALARPRRRRWVPKGMASSGAGRMPRAEVPVGKRRSPPSMRIQIGETAPAARRLAGDRLLSIRGRNSDITRRSRPAKILWRTSVKEVADASAADVAADGSRQPVMSPRCCRCGSRGI